MTFVAILLLAALVALLWLRNQGGNRLTWLAVGGTLAVGLFGYALAGAPLLPGRPAPPKADDAQAPAEFEDARQRLLSNYGDTAAWLAFADALSRQGRTVDAVEGLQLAIRAMPDNPDLWVGLGNTLTVHGGGTVSPAARLAFDRASAIDPQHPAPPYFLALAWIQAGEPDEAAKVLEALKARSPANAPWMPQVDRLLRGAQAMMAAGVDGGRFPAQMTPPKGR